MEQEKGTRTEFATQEVGIDATNGTRRARAVDLLVLFPRASGGRGGAVFVAPGTVPPERNGCGGL